MFKKDSWILGLIVGFGLPALLYAILYFANIFFSNQFNSGVLYVQKSTIMLISIFVNMFTMRYYLVTKKWDKAGRGILLLTFIFAGIFFYFYN